MNTQTLNRMIKASYSAPNGAQLRKACYGLLSVKSRRASENPAVALEQIEQLPQQEQVEVKADILTKTLVEESAKDQAKLGTEKVKSFLEKKRLSPQKVYEIALDYPRVLKIVKSTNLKPREMISLCLMLMVASVEAQIDDAFRGVISEAVMAEEFSTADINWKRIVLMCICIVVFCMSVVGVTGGALGYSVGLLILAPMIAYAKKDAIAIAIIYFFDNIEDWQDQVLTKIEKYIGIFKDEVYELSLKAYGWLFGTWNKLENAFSNFFARQASIAMQSPQFRRAYYNI